MRPQAWRSKSPEAIAVFIVGIRRDGRLTSKVGDDERLDKAAVSDQDFGTSHGASRRSVRRMEIHQLRYFVAVAEESSFSHAAEREHVSQPSLSQQIHKLEEELNQQLFDRLPCSVVLTEAGRCLLPYAREIVAALADARRAALSVTLSHRVRRTAETTRSSASQMVGFD